MATKKKAVKMGDMKPSKDAKGGAGRRQTAGGSTAGRTTAGRTAAGRTTRQ
ncbi:MAG: hypothetical protein H0W43_10210 [Chthoniobacterales bacterium]|nr:hypothetical protein [Chthoniobacterales bacterium]